MKGPIAWFARNHVAANLLLGVIVVAGVVSLPRMPQKSFPDTDIGAIRIAVEYLGAAPEEVEEGVCIRIEEELEGIEGIERIRSVANEGACAVTVELFDDADQNLALDDVKNRVDSIDTFPEEAEKPIINLLTPQRPVMELAVTGRDLSVDSDTSSESSGLGSDIGSLSDSDSEGFGPGGWIDW